MPFSKFIVFPIFVAIQAAIMMIMTPYIKLAPESIGGPGLITWISFQAWAMYFLGGCTPKAAVKTVIGYAGGIIASIIIFYLMGMLIPCLGTTWGPPLAVFIVVVPLMCVEKIEILNFIPAWFIGAGVFFGLVGMYKAVTSTQVVTMSEYIAIAIPEMVACIIGLVFGYVTVTFRTKYEKMVMPQAEEATEETAEKTEESA